MVFHKKDHIRKCWLIILVGQLCFACFQWQLEVASPCLAESVGENGVNCHREGGRTLDSRTGCSWFWGGLGQAVGTTL